MSALAYTAKRIAIDEVRALTEVADALWSFALLQDAAGGAMRTEDAPTRTTMMSPGEEVKRDVTLVAGFHAFIRQPERTVAARQWPCKGLDALQQCHAASIALVGSAVCRDQLNIPCHGIANAFAETCMIPA